MMNETFEPYTLTRVARHLNFNIVAQVHEYYVEYVIYDIEGFDENSLPLFHKAGDDTSPSPVATIEESEPYLNGSVKWDGCSNWYFDEQDRAMLHGCSKSDVQRFGDVMAMCWDWTAELCPNWMD